MSVTVDPYRAIPDEVRNDPYFKLGAAEQSVRILLGRGTLTDADRNTVLNLASALGIEVAS